MPRSNRKGRLVNVRIEEELPEEVMQMVKEKRTTFSELVRSLLIVTVRKHKAIQAKARAKEGAISDVPQG